MQAPGAAATGSARLGRARRSRLRVRLGRRRRKRLAGGKLELGGFRAAADLDVVVGRDVDRPIAGVGAMRPPHGEVVPVLLIGALIDLLAAFAGIDDRAAKTQEAVERA